MKAIIYSLFFCMALVGCYAMDSSENEPRSHGGSFPWNNQRSNALSRQYKNFDPPEKYTKTFSEDSTKNVHKTARPDSVFIEFVSYKKRSGIFKVVNFTGNAVWLYARKYHDSPYLLHSIQIKTLDGWKGRFSRLFWCGLDFSPYVEIKLKPGQQMLFYIPVPDQHFPQKAKQFAQQWRVGLSVHGKRLRNTNKRSIPRPKRKAINRIWSAPLPLPPVDEMADDFHLWR